MGNWQSQSYDVPSHNCGIKSHNYEISHNQIKKQNYNTQSHNYDLKI